MNYRRFPLFVVALLGVVLGIALSQVFGHVSLSAQATKTQTPRPTYSIVSMEPGTFGNPVEQTLNRMASQGWDLHSVNGPDLIFVKR